MGLGWKNKYGKGNGADTITSGLEGAWTSTPARWSYQYLTNLWNYEWVLTKSPAGAQQWTPKDGAGAGTVAHRPQLLQGRHADGGRAPVMDAAAGVRRARRGPVRPAVDRAFVQPDCRAA